MNAHITIYGPQGDSIRLKIGATIQHDTEGRWFINRPIEGSIKEHFIELPESFMNGTATDKEFETLCLAIREAGIEEKKQ